MHRISNNPIIGKNMSSIIMFAVSIVFCLVEFSIVYSAEIIEPINSQTSNFHQDLEVKVEHMNQLDRKYVERMRKSYIEANSKEFDREFFFAASNEFLAKGVALYLEQKTEGSVKNMVRSKFGVDDYRLMFSIHIVNPCMQVALELETFIGDRTSSSDQFESEWLQTTRMCKNIIDNKDLIEEKSFKILISRKR